MDESPGEAEQRREHEEYAAKMHAKGRCEFSGLRALSCVRSICDCFASEEWAREIERKART